jgi:hypothetical protein
MNEHRFAVRFFAGLLAAGVIAVGGVAPAQAATGWSTSVSSHKAQVSQDTGWNGT